MWRILVMTAAAGLLNSALSLAASPQTRQDPGDYLRLQQVRIVDQHGFGRPMDAASLLLPKDWKVESSVRWTGDVGCPENAVHLSMKAHSPDGRLAFELFPNFVWKWSDDPQVLQSAQQAMAPFGIKGCDALPPYDAATYLQQVLLPRWRSGSTLVGIGQVPELAQALQLEHQAATASLPAVVQTDFDVALAAIEMPGAGRTDEEWVIATVMRSATPMPSIASMWSGQMQMANSYSMVALSQFAARAPKGELEQHERLFELIYRSFRFDPKWEAAYVMFMQNVAAIQRQGVADRARIITDMNREIGEMIHRGYVERQVSRDRTFDKQIQALRNVESWFDPATETRVELSAGYRNAWSNGLGDYILSDAPGFNPESVLGGRWSPLQPDRQ